MTLSDATALIGKIYPFSKNCRNYRTNNEICWRQEIYIFYYLVSKGGVQKKPANYPHFVDKGVGGSLNVDK